MKLLGAELTRLSKRRLTWFVFLGLLAFIATMTSVNYLENREPSAEQLANQERWYQEAVTDWEVNGEAQKLACEEAEQTARTERPGTPVDYGCMSMEPPQRDWYIYSPPVLADNLDNAAQSSIEVFALAALVLGAGLVGAEFVSGSMSTWLTFEPRRNRVFTTKVLAAGVGVAALSLASYVILALATAAVCAINGGDLSLTAQDWTGFVFVVLRTWIVLIGIGMAAAAATFAARHTAAIVSIGMAGAFFSLMAVQLKPSITPLSPLANAYAAIQGRYEYRVWDCGVNALGEHTCTTAEKFVHWPQATAYLLALFVALLTIGIVAFRKRDVN